MPISEELAIKLQEAVDNNQVRLANVYFLEVLSEIVPALQQTIERVESIEAFLSSDDSEDIIVEEQVVEQTEKSEKKSKTKPAKEEKTSE